jgi:hypothetical protein
MVPGRGTWPARALSARTHPIVGEGMAKMEDEAWVQLATRIPKALHRDLKLHCVVADMSVMDFVVAALRERLGNVDAKAQGARRRRAGGAVPVTGRGAARPGDGRSGRQGTRGLPSRGAPE